MKVFFYVFCICALFAGVSTSSAQVKSAVTLTWQDNSNNEQGFGIEMLSPGAPDFAEVGTAGANTSEYKMTVSGNYGDRFCFRVYAYNETGDSPDSNIVCTSLPDTPPPPPVNAPSTPGGLHSTSVSPGSIGIAWDDDPDETQYFLERREGNTTEMSIVLAADQTSYTDQGLKRNHTYCYRIAAANSIGLSPFSEYFCIDTPPNNKS